MSTIGDSHAKTTCQTDDSSRSDNGSETAKQIILMEPEEGLMYVKRGFTLDDRWCHFILISVHKHTCMHQNRVWSAIIEHITDKWLYYCWCCKWNMVAMTKLMYHSTESTLLALRHKLCRCHDNQFMSFSNSVHTVVPHNCDFFVSAFILPLYTVKRLCKTTLFFW